MTRIIAGIAAIALVAALAPWPYDYYRLLRVLVFGAGVFCGIALLEKDRGLAIGLFISAAVFNPFLPAHLTRDIWSVLNIAGAALFALSIYRLRRA
jgi:hypothetical protein